MKSWHRFAKVSAGLVFLVLLGLLIARALAQAPPKDFDVVATALDANRFPLNPQWGQQVRSNTLPSPKSSCPVDSQNSGDWTSSAQYPNCTSIPMSFNSGWICGAHANFLPVAYVGSVAWATGPNWFDHDYSFDVTRQDSALYSTAGSDVHVEFDATETVDNWDGTQTWWETFHHQGADAGDDKAHAMIDGHTAIIIGLLGMDTQHGAKTELHPVYSMFVLVGTGRTSVAVARGPMKWAFFARNWGNEGYCGDDQENLYDQTLRVQIDNAGSILSSNIWGGARNTNDLSGLSIGAAPSHHGILVTLNLLPPDKQSWIEGDITFQPARPVFLPSAVGAAQPVAHPSREPEVLTRADRALKAQLDKLPQSSRRAILAQQLRMVPTKKGRQLRLVNISKPTVLDNTRLPSSRRILSTPAVVRRTPDHRAVLNRQKQRAMLRVFLAKKKIESRSL